ncbi:hypothetical protein NM688_g7325 [Phlebia brevispora]|uniref:Uncharacterized protein n=1 Tax=Phlebia brevispora TaxID=194682 RepID=A0ACC1S6M0_9APHY|nr:hypothetical protein NM688_g7325 [Phlebia brevispora]
MGGEQRELHRERERVVMKRYHALMELLTTEVGYLMDLRALVTIYLAHLPTLYTPIPSPALSRPSPSSLSISSLSRSRLPSSRSSMLVAPSAGPGPPLSDCPSSYFDKYFETSVDRDPEKGKGDKERQARRPIFAEADLQIVRRNAEQLLQLHQRFVSALREKLEPLGYGSAFVDVLTGREKDPSIECGPTQLDTVDEAIDVVADAFSSEASSFDIYESFCPGHNEAASLRCSLRVAHEFELALQAVYPSSPRPEQLAPSPGITPSSTAESLRRKRRHSTSSVAMSVVQPAFGVVSPSSSHLNVMAPNKSEPTSGHKRKASGSSTSTVTGNTGQAGRLKFLDYLIKPVQRLCKYPLLLDQLRVKRRQLDTEPDFSAVANACNAMRGLAAQVDNASEWRARQVKSVLIVARLVPSSPSSPISSEGHEEKSAQLTADFMRSLGVCLLAGALEVVYPQSGGGLRGKYLAAFLYAGGYLVLAKVPKGGKIYEPRHWFPLRGFEVVDEPEDDPALPYAFHLLSQGHHLHLAAACQLEKTVWMASIHDAGSMQPPEWAYEPIPSIPADDRPPMSATEEFAPDWSAPLPTIQSMSDLETTPDPNAPAPPFPSPRKLAKTVSRADGAAIREYQLSALNRRTSTSSVKAFFAPLSFDSRITRPSSQIRQQVDQGLHDVFSEAFVTVRSQTQMRDEELFQLRRKQGNMSRSNSGLSISGAFTTRRRHESTMILPSRRKGSIDGVPDLLPDMEFGQKSSPVPISKRSRSKSGVAKRRGKLPLSVVPSQSSYMDNDAPVVQSPEGSLETPSPLTQSSSTSSSNPGSTLPSPMDLSIPLPMPCPMSGTGTIRASDSRKMDYRPKRARSMVDNVKHFFHTRSISPSPSVEASPKIPVVSLDVETDTPGGLVQWWRRGSLRRRVQSSPEVPTDDSSPPTPAASSEDSHISTKSLLSAGPSTPSSEPSPGPPINHPLLVRHPVELPSQTLRL